MIEIKHGPRQFEYGPGVIVSLSGDDVATAIEAWLVAHGMHISGPRTVAVNGGLCKAGEVFVDPSGSVYYAGDRWSGRGPNA